MSHELASADVSFTLGRKDVKTFFDEYIAYVNQSPLPHLRSSGRSLVLYNLTAYGIPILALILSLIWFPELISILFSLGILFFYFWVWLVYGVHYRLGLARLYRSYLTVGEQQVRLRPEGFSIRTSVSEGTLFWTHISDITVTRHHIFIVGGPESDGMIRPIPLHAFASQEEAERFVEQAIRHWKNAPDPHTL